MYTLAIQFMIYIPYVPMLPYPFLNLNPIYSKFNYYGQWCAIMPYCNPNGLFLNSVSFNYIFFLFLFFHLIFFKSYLLDLNFMCHGCGIMHCIQTLSAQMVNGSNSSYENCTSFFIRLTALNDEKIDKDLLLAKFVPSNITAYLTTVMTAVCSR